MARIKPQALLQQSKRKKGTARVGITTIIACNSILLLLMLSVIIIHRHRVKGGTDSGVSHLGTLEGQESFDLIKRHQIERAPRFAVLNTTKGLVSVELFLQSAPKTVELFVKHSRKGYYNGLIFHRVIKHFMIQGGDPTRAGMREDWTQGGHLNDELEASLKHEPFMLATSKSEPDSFGFELFITTTAIPHLDDKLSVFGRVVRGEDVVQEIEEVDTDEHFRPKSPVQIHNIVFYDEL